MKYTGLILPERELKPRNKGLTILIDNGLPLYFFKDTIQSNADYIDFVKFGWGTSLITPKLEEKIECLQENGIDFFFGGTLFEKFLSQGKMQEYYDFCVRYGCRYIEVSNGTIELSNQKKAFFISDLAKDFTVFSEVGSKDTSAASYENSSKWLEWILEDFEAGATKVITEARETGTSGLCSANGDIRFDIFEEIQRSGISLDQMIFEAPNKNMQTFFITKAGVDVNLANIAFSDALALETLRLGLRSDTFSLFEK